MTLNTEKIFISLPFQQNLRKAFVQQQIAFLSKTMLSVLDNSVFVADFQLCLTIFKIVWSSS